MITAQYDHFQQLHCIHSVCCMTKYKTESRMRVRLWCSTLIFSGCEPFKIHCRKGICYRKLSVLSARVPECQKIRKGGLDQYGPEHFEL